MPQTTVSSSLFATRRAVAAVLRAALSLAVLFTALGNARPVAAAVPLGFTDNVIADNVGSPTALAFTPDGRLLITTQPGQLPVYQNGSLVGTPALNLATQWPGGSRVCSNFERGLLGIAVDPNFATNNYIYLYYTYNKNNACPGSSVVNRVSRFILLSNNVIITTTETILLDNIPSTNGNHNAGDLHFGADGLLYISAGDAGTGGGNARVKTNLAGKILRIESDGDIPPGNPFIGDANSWRCGNPAGGSGTGSCQEIFAYGLRNPFRFAFQPGTNTFYINDVGQDRWEEVDVGQAGADYGWNVREGPCPANTYCAPSLPSAYTDLLYYYRHDTTGCGSITGGAFVPAGVWPAAYEGKYLFADYVCGKIFRLDPVGGGAYTATDFATSLGGSSAVHMIFGPYNSTQALYYTSYASNGDVHRVVYTATGNTPPIAVADASPRYGASSTLMVNFDSAGSNDPDNNTPLSYQWDFGDNSLYGSGISPTHNYTSTGVYTATLTVIDSLGAVSAPVSLRIDVGNTPPAPTITAPLSTTQFYVGQVVTLTGSVTDTQDVTVPSSAWSWNVILHHVDQDAPGNAHTHPILGPVSGNNVPFAAPAPEGLQATAMSTLEIQLTATDSWGLATTITQTLQPNRVNVTFVTSPVGFDLSVNGTTITTTQTLVSWQSYALNVFAPPQYQSGQWWAMTSWSDGGAIAHTISTPASAATYTATFVSAQLVWLPVAAQ